MHSCILACLVVACFAASQSNSKLRPTRLSKTDDNVCTTEACKEIASSLQRIMDTSADPCTDFYQYTCGNYPSTIEKATTYNRFAEIKNQNLKRMKEIFEEPHQIEDPALHKKVTDYYASCVNIDEIQQAGLQPVLSLLKQLGGWPTADTEWHEGNSDDWTTILYKLMDIGLGYNYIFGLTFWYTNEQQSYTSVEMVFPSLTLSTAALETGSTSDNDEYRNHVDLLLKLAISFGADPYQAQTDINHVLRLERALLHAWQSEKPANNTQVDPQEKILKHQKSNQPDFLLTHFPKPGEEATKIDLEKLNADLPSVNWTLFFNKALQAESLQSLHIVSSNPNYVYRAIEILDSTSKRTVINYLLLRAVLDTYEYLDVQQHSKRDVICTEETDKQLFMITSNIYLTKITRNGTKEIAQDMVDKLHTKFKERMQRADWMDETTKKIAIDKLLSIKQIVAYSDELTNMQYLEEFHGAVEIHDNTYFENRLHTRRLRQKYDMIGFSTSMQDHIFWIRKVSPISTVNAEYNPISNAIWMPAGILQGAFFNADRPQSTNFGSIGAVIGHEFTHGFDSKGSQYTKDGIIKEWWAPETRNKFNKKAQCLENQFNSVYIPEIGRSLNGTQTLGENIADNGGFREAYEAYEEWLKTNEREPLLPGLVFNHRQLFWLSTAHMWCEKSQRDDLLQTVEVNVHSPNKYRVNVAFKNFEEFAKDFGCPSGSPMRPEDTCQLW